MEANRNRDGVTTIDDITVTVPKDTPVLKVLGTRIYDGDYFNSDGYVYNPRMNKRKYFEHVDEIRVWGPVLKDIKSLEERYHKVKKKYFNTVPELWTTMVDRLAQEAPFGGIIQGNREIYFEARERPEGKMIMWNDYPRNYMDRIPRGLSSKEDRFPIYQNLVDYYWEMERIRNKYNGYYHKFYRVLERALETYCLDNFPPKYGYVKEIYVFDINGRRYVVIATRSKYSLDYKLQTSQYFESITL